jgi:hypothetical protein
MLTSASDEGEWSASIPGRLTPGERAPETYWIGGWVGSRAGLSAVVKRGNPCRCWESNRGRPDRSRVTILTELSRLVCYHNILKHLNVITFWNELHKLKPAEARGEATPLVGWELAPWLRLGSVMSRTLWCTAFRLGKIKTGQEGLKLLWALRAHSQHTKRLFNASSVRLSVCLRVSGHYYYYYYCCCCCCCCCCYYSGMVMSLATSFEIKEPR